MEKFIQDFTRNYILCAIWASTMGDDIGTPLDEHYTDEDLSECAVEALAEDCRDFCQDNWDVLQRYQDIPGCNARQAGHDFWLTRNGHGAGFWDRGIGPIGDELTNLAADHGSQDLYVGDDHKIYVY